MSIEGLVKFSKNDTSVAFSHISCNMEIKDSKKELRIPAMWYSCFSCQKKFDDVVMKLHCREFNHDFDTNMARTTTIHCFKLKDLETERNFGSSLLENLKNLLLKFEYHSEENCSIKGKSGDGWNCSCPTG